MEHLINCHGSEFLNTVEKAVLWVGKMQLPYLQVYPDTGNITNAKRAEGGTVIADMPKGKGHIAAVHLKELVPGVYREVSYGTGHVDFAAIAKTARELGVGMFVGEFWEAGYPIGKML